MKSDRAWLIVVMGIACLQLTACGQAMPSATASEAKPATIEHLDGAEPTRVILTEEAAARLDVQVAAAKDVVVNRTRFWSIPYASIVYDTEGNTWTYTNPEPLTFVRHPIKVDHIAGDEAIVSEGLTAGTSVVTVGTAELYGSESEFEEE